MSFEKLKKELADFKREVSESSLLRLDISNYSGLSKIIGIPDNIFENALQGVEMLEKKIKIIDENNRIILKKNDEFRIKIQLDKENNKELIKLKQNIELLEKDNVRQKNQNSENLRLLSENKERFSQTKLKLELFKEEVVQKGEYNQNAQFEYQRRRDSIERSLNQIASLETELENINKMTNRSSDNLKQEVEAIEKKCNEDFVKVMLELESVEKNINSEDNEETKIFTKVFEEIREYYDASILLYSILSQCSLLSENTENEFLKNSTEVRAILNEGEKQYKSLDAKKLISLGIANVEKLIQSEWKNEFGSKEMPNIVPLMFSNGLSSSSSSSASIPFDGFEEKKTGSQGKPE